eukprot:sb/3474753/
MKYSNFYKSRDLSTTTEQPPPPPPAAPSQNALSPASSGSDDDVIPPRQRSNDVTSSTADVMSLDKLQYLLDVYKMIQELQRSNNRRKLTDITNILSGDGESGMCVGEENVTFDLKNCNMETLSNIRNLLMRDVF